MGLKVTVADSADKVCVPTDCESRMRNFMARVALAQKPFIFANKAQLLAFLQQRRMPDDLKNLLAAELAGKADPWTFLTSNPGAPVPPGTHFFTRPTTPTLAWAR